MASYFRQAREWATPTLKSSAFLDRGVLTPEEFVQAGDELVYRCPTWQWESSTKPSKSYLPTDKQYLITRNVPCPTRCRTLEGETLNFERVHAEGGDSSDDDWLVSTKFVVAGTETNDSKIEDEFDILDEDGEVVVPDKPSAAGTTQTAEGGGGGGGATGNNDDDEYADMMDDDDAMVDDNVLLDDDMAVATTNDNIDGGGGGASDNVLKVRTYDLSITYDKYYQTPRIFLIGRGPDDQPLTAKEMMQDVMSDYANKTVTIESHPHVSGPHASIHPCQHGKVMKAIVRNLIKSAQDKPPSVEMYLFIFLKFVSSMIPTINYDFTMDVQADTKK